MSEPPYPGQMPGLPAADPLISADYSGWWQRAITLVKATWRELLVLQLIGAAVGLVLRGPASIFQALAVRDIRDAANARTNALDLGNLFVSLGLNVLALCLAFLVTALVTLASVHVVVAAATGARPVVGDALRRAAGRLVSMVGWQILALLIVVAGICACILPGIYFALVFLVLPPVVAIERGNAISRCFRLFHGNLVASLARVGTIVGIAIVSGIVAGAIGSAFAAIVTHPAAAGTGALVVGNLLTTAVAVAITGAIGILTAPMTVLTYADMRARIEPVSTGVLAQELNAAP